MGFGPDLDLSGILSNFGLWLTPDKEERDDAPEVDGVKFPVPIRLGQGPVEWSTSMEVAVPIVIKWDVNGYYRALGVKPDASRKELREAYQERDGQSSVRLTHILKTLLNPETRQAYDATPLGEPFMDENTEIDLKRRAHQEAGRRSAAGATVSGEQVLDEWGFRLVDGVDSVTPNRQDQSCNAAPSSWSYSYYGWKTSSFLVDVNILQRWQECLSRAASEHTWSPSSLSLGSTADLSDRPYILETVGDRRVIFFSEKEVPSDMIARQAIAEIADSTTQPPVHSDSHEEAI